MAETIVDFFRNKIPPELIIFLVSLLPILELRGGLIAAALLGVDWWIAFPICVIGNILPIPFILLFLKKIFALLKKTKTFRKMVEKLEKKASTKSKKLTKSDDKVDEKKQKRRILYRMGALFLFVGVPLPGTGAWTGALIADAINMRIKHSLPAIIGGVLLAGIIISIISYVIPGWLLS
ncbi:MAG TPA: small multi-drug export protein [Firmicutes bacterium]|nr:small multi-drug export protein [Bacillota bacterium]